MMLHIRTKIPVSISGAFWLVAAAIGFLNSFSVVGTLVWIGIIFFSVLIHELGHALTALLFGLKPRIELIAWGGLTYHDGGKLPFWKQFFIVFDGPLFGFLLFVAAYFLLFIPSLATGISGEIITLFQRVNLFWTILNLLPVLPLDGGHLLRVILEGIFGYKGLKYSLVVSMILATGLSLYFFLFQYFLVGAIFFLLAFQSYETWKQSRSLAEPDQKEDFKRALEEAEKALQSGDEKQAEELFEDLRKKSKQGLIFNLSTQYLAFIKYDLGKGREAYDLLLSIRKELSSDSLCLLQKLSLAEKNYSLVVDLAGACYQIEPKIETAIRNAYACAYLSQAEASVGWLETALQDGLENVKEIIQDKAFDTIRNSSYFQEFLKKHS